MLPTGDQEIISVGDTAADVALPVGFDAVSLDIESDEYTRNFTLTLSIDSAYLLNGGEIKNVMILLQETEHRPHAQ